MTTDELEILTRIDGRSRQWSVDGGQTWLDRWSELSRSERSSVTDHICWKLRCTEDRAAAIAKQLLT